MKKIIPIALLITLTLVLVSCMGQAITPNEPYDMADGIQSGEFKEINFTVATYNVKGGDATIESISKINKSITDIGADIAGLQEVDNLSKRSGKKDFLGIFKGGELRNVSYFPIMLKGYGETYGIATISKTPFERSHAFKLPYPFKYEKSSVEKRIVMRSLLSIDSVQIAFYNTHLAYEETTMPDGKSLRTSQMEFILELLESDPCPYKIVTGDFNVTSFKEYQVFTDSKYKIVNNDQNKFDTYKGSDVDFFAIDNIIYSGSLQLRNFGANDSDASDHKMLYANFATIQ